MILGIPPTTPIEKFLKWSTSVVDVLSCSPKVVSMDEVFLRAVKNAECEELVNHSR